VDGTNDYPPRPAKIAVCEWEDERIEIHYRRRRRWTGNPRSARNLTRRQIIPGSRGCWPRQPPGMPRRFGLPPALRSKRSTHGLAGLRSGGPKRG